MANLRDDAERFAQTVAAQIRAELAASGTTVTELSRRTAINRETLDRWVKGERKVNVSTLYSIAAALGVNASLIVERAEERFSAESGESTASLLPRIGLAALDPETAPLDDELLAATDDVSQSTIDGGHIGDENQDV